MTAFNFPNSPIYNETYEYYSWDGEKWYLTVGGVGSARPGAGSILTGVIGWWDASVYSSMTIASTTINAIADLSGNGNHLTTSLGPIYNATYINGKPGMQYGSTQGNNLYRLNFALGTGNTLTTMMVLRMNSADTGVGSPHRHMAYTRNGTTNDFDNPGSFAITSSGSGGPDTKFTRNSVDASTSTIGYDHPRCVITTVKSDGTVTVYVDGVAVSSAQAVNNWLSPGCIALGWSLNNNYIFQQFGGAIGEAAISPNWHDATTVAALWEFQKTKWALDPLSKFLNRTSGLDSTHINAYTALINGMVADGIWDKFDALYIFATQNTATAQLNLVTPRFPASLVGSPTFTADRGYTGVNASSTVYINSNFNPAQFPANWKFTQNSGHLSCWVVTNAVTTNAAIGQNTASPANNYILAQYTGGDAYFRINDFGSSGIQAAVPASTGHFIGNRSGANNIQGYRNGASLGTSTSDGSVAVINSNIFMLGSNNNGTANGSSHQQAAASIGASLNSTEAAAFYARLRTYMTAVGVP